MARPRSISRRNRLRYLAQTPFAACRGGIIPAWYSTALKDGFRPIIDIVSATAMTARDLALFERRDALLCALEILKEEQPGAYKAALAELDEQTRTSWQERLAPRA